MRKTNDSECSIRCLEIASSFLASQGRSKGSSRTRKFLPSRSKEGEYENLPRAKRALTPPSQEPMTESGHNGINSWVSMGKKLKREPKEYSCVSWEQGGKRRTRTKSKKKKPKIFEGFELQEIRCGYLVWDWFNAIDQSPDIPPSA